MKLAYVHLNGFRGYTKPVRFEFAEAFTIIDGRNGVGKSTIFDAVEFALTGNLSKYGDARADRESVSNYVWWRGNGSAPAERYVEVAFTTDDGDVSIRRTEFEEPTPSVLVALTSKLIDTRTAPMNAVAQLCAAAIIRDEQIAELSLDLAEADRYAFLRDALGANDAERWIDRGKRIAAAAKRRADQASTEVANANGEAANAARRLDEVRANLATEPVLADAISRLRRFAGSEAAPDLLAGPVRERIVVTEADVSALRELAERWAGIEAARAHLSGALEALNNARKEEGAAASAYVELQGVPDASSSTIAARAADLIALSRLGRRLGLFDGKCPLCASTHTAEEYELRLVTTELLAEELDGQAADAAKREESARQAQARLSSAREAVNRAESNVNAVRATVDAFESLRDARGFRESTLDAVEKKCQELEVQLEAAKNDLRLLETLKLNIELELGQQAQWQASNRLARAQDQLSRARRAHAVATAFHDAARRAAGETLDLRLERVLPLMAELYRRMRPHPVWCDLEYSIRGDVKRFLKLAVGDELNPQFMFSSGQRRATGLAFLLALNLSLAWSRWRSILLDDPVQHVDDFRAVNLAEVLAQLVIAGRQVICAVEDPALADLLCRRLPIEVNDKAKRITLSTDDDGALAIVADRTLAPLARSTFLPQSTRPAAAG